MLHRFQDWVQGLTLKQGWELARSSGQWRMEALDVAGGNSHSAQWIGGSLINRAEGRAVAETLRLDAYIVVANCWARSAKRGDTLGFGQAGILSRKERSQTGTSPGYGDIRPISQELG